MGHSLGAISCFIYAATFPGIVDSVVALDALLPRLQSTNHMFELTAGLEAARESDLKFTAGEEPQTYTFEELIEKVNSQTLLSVTRASAVRLLARGVQDSRRTKDRYYFTIDARLRTFQIALYTLELNESFAQSIDCPILYVKALQSAFRNTESDQQDSVLHILMDKSNFEMTTVDSGHHVHLNEPALIIAGVSEFLLKHTANPESLLPTSKL